MMPLVSGFSEMGGVIRDEKEVILQEVVAVFTRDIFHIHDAIGGQISETLIVPAVHIPFGQILSLDFRRINCLGKEISIFVFNMDMPAFGSETIFCTVYRLLRNLFNTNPSLHQETQFPF